MQSLLLKKGVSLLSIYTPAEVVFHTVAEVEVADYQRVDVLDDALLQLGHHRLEGLLLGAVDRDDVKALERDCDYLHVWEGEGMSASTY